VTVQPVAYAPVQAAPNGYAPQVSRRRQGISSLVYGWPKAGKSNLADSGPAPGLIVDIEGQATWTARRKIEWDPMRSPPPQPDRRVTAGYGQPSITPAWESALAIVRESRAIGQIYQVLSSGRHPFSSASVDSVTEMQQRIIDGLVGARAMQLQDWGSLLRQANLIIRQWRDLITHPVKPLWSVSFVAGMHLDQKIKKYRPLLQGAGQDYVGYFVDLEGYLEPQQDGTRLLYTGFVPGYETGERLGGRLPPVMPIGYPGRQPGWTLESMVTHVLANL
jgi:hypothetical protein